MKTDNLFFYCGCLQFMRLDTENTKEKICCRCKTKWKVEEKDIPAGKAIYIFEVDGGN